jgi:signal transduction histidine kinase
VRRIERRALKSDPAFTALRPLLDRAPWESAAVFPLVAAGVLLGELAVHLRPDQMIEDEDFLRALADQTVVAIRNASLLRTVERDATLVERHRLARDLHDSVSQALFSMTLHAAAAQRHLSASGLEQHAAAVEVRRLHDLTRAALAEMRALIFELRPEALKAEGLAQALSRHAAAVAAREGIPVRVSSPSRRLALAPAVEENLYRLALEALNNAIKHAAPDEILIEMEVRPEEGLVITVRDDGCGFDLRADHPGHMGMSTMRDRARAAGGQLEIESAPGAGTAVTVRLPTPR